jgi:enamine deaminase RidA (YjgF/YER057c/UK114 family)
MEPEKLVTNMRTNYSTGAKWESIVGYSRAVRIGNVIEIAGTTSVVDGQFVHEGDAYNQTKTIIEIAEKVLNQAGAALTDVIRTRMYVTRISDWEAVGRAHGEAFGEIRPATTLVEVKGLVDDRMLVEIEFTAYLSE